MISNNIYIPMINESKHWISNIDNIFKEKYINNIKNNKELTFNIIDRTSDLFKECMDLSIFCKYAYDKKLYNLINDYIRCYSVYENGGLSIENNIIIHDFSLSLLNNEYFFICKNDEISDKIIGSEIHAFFMKGILNIYDNYIYEEYKNNLNEHMNITYTLLDNIYSIRLNGILNLYFEQMSNRKINIINDYSKRLIYNDDYIDMYSDNIIKKMVSI